MQVQEKEARELLAAMGLTKLAAKPVDQIAKKLQDVHKLVPDADEVTGDAQDLLAAICKAREEGEEVEVVAGEGTTEEADGEEAPAKAKGKKAPKERAASGGTRPRHEVLGHPATRVLKWMGANGWAFPEARKALDALGGKAVSDSTVRTAMGNGKRGQPSADLTPKQVKELKTAAK